MKTTSRNLLLAAALACAMAGCSTLDKALFGSRVETIPGQIIGTNTVYRTNYVTIPAVTNADGSVTPAYQTARVTPDVTYIYSEPTYQTNLVSNPLVESVIATTGALPLPFAGTAGLVLGWAYTLYRNVRNKQIAVALAKSIEAGRAFLKETKEGQVIDEKFTRLLSAHQNSAGVLTEVRKLLDAYIHK